MAVVEPSFDVERELLARYRLVIGVDEVGRGALAGPVTVGAVVVSAQAAPFPVGLRDSKLLSEPRRVALDPLCRSWADAWGLGSSSAAEIDERGIIAALGAAGADAVDTLGLPDADLAEAVVLLDGAHDWLSPALAARGRSIVVTTRVKADANCAAVAAASVIAKVSRDTLMRELDEAYPHYGWAANKGYGSAAHLDALNEHGLCRHHRRTWVKGAA